MSVVFQLKPNAYVQGKLYTAVPIDGEGDFLFTSGGQTTGNNESLTPTTYAQHVPTFLWVNERKCPAIVCTEDTFLEGAGFAPNTFDGTQGRFSADVLFTGPGFFSLSAGSNSNGISFSGGADNNPVVTITIAGIPKVINIPISKMPLKQELSVSWSSSELEIRVNNVIVEKLLGDYSFPVNILTQLQGANIDGASNKLTGLLRDVVVENSVPSFEGKAPTSFSNLAEALEFNIQE